MTTRQETKTVARLLKDKRAGGYKAEAARTIGVSRQIYDAWESGHFIPGDEWAEQIAFYLDRELAEIVMRLYNDRAVKRADNSPQLDITWSYGVPVGEWGIRPIDVKAAA